MFYQRTTRLRGHPAGGVGERTFPQLEKTRGVHPFRPRLSRPRRRGRGGAVRQRCERTSARHSNVQRYRRGERHHAYGGLATRSPVRISIPRNGHWHAAVDMQGLRGTTKASFRIVPSAALRPLPPIREPHSDLAAIAENVADVVPPTGSDDLREFDVFVSHATEDKDTVVRPLAGALQERGLKVWYDEFELRVGDSLRRKIDVGISRSRFGIVVPSRPFFAKGWSQYELDGLVTMAVSGKQVLLPLWHEISKDEVIRQAPPLRTRWRCGPPTTPSPRSPTSSLP